MPKASDDDKNRFRDLIETVAHIPGVEVKPMFGQLGAFVNGNMFAGLFGSSIGVKLDEQGATQLRDLGGGPFGPEERPMGGYTTIPDALEPQAWVEREEVVDGPLADAELEGEVTLAQDAVGVVLAAAGRRVRGLWSVMSLTGPSRPGTGQSLPAPVRTSRRAEERAM